MVRWIAFDDDTADALVGKFKRGAAEIREGNVLDSVLHNDQASILIYPSTSPERVLLARVTATAASTKTPDTSHPLPVQSIRHSTTAPAPRKAWWRRNTA